MVNLSLGEDYAAILEKLSDKVRERFNQAEKSQIDSLIDFSRHFYAAAPLEELATKRIEDLYGATVALWDFIQHRDTDKPKIRVFNPKFEDHGWQGTHTIVEILVPDKAFVVESMMMEFTRRDISIHSVTNAAFCVARDDSGTLKNVKFGQNSGECVSECLMHIEVDRQSNEETIRSIVEELLSIVDELTLAVNDFQSMLDRTVEISTGLNCPGSVEELTLDEATAFLKWLVDNHFTFLGLKEYRVVDQGSQKKLEAVEGTAKGICRLDHTIDLMEDDGGPLLLADRLLVFAKSGRKSRLHRPVYMDFVSIRKFDKGGRVIGEYRLLGLYTSRVFNNSPRDFPIIGRKLEDVIQGSGLTPNSHDGKRLFQILETFPREELFQTSTNELLATAVGILQIQERRRLRLFVRKGQYGRFISCLIYTPREGFSTALRKKFQEVLCEYVDAQDLEFNTYFTESTLARLYIVIRVSEGSVIDMDAHEIESRLVDLARSWADRLYETLTENHGEERASALHSNYMDAFSIAYRNDFSTRTAVSDIEHMETLGSERELSVSFYRALEEDPHSLRFKIFRLGGDVPLSDILPMLENLGFRVLGGRPYHVREKNGARVSVYDFSVRYRREKIIELDKVKKQFQEAFYQIWHGAAENDSFNRLVLAVGLGWRSVAMLRAYARFFKQTGFSFSQRYIKDALVNQPNITRMLVELFNARFSVDTEESEIYEANLTGDILDALDNVDSLDEDRILRRYLDMMAATLRTNFFQTDEQGNTKEYISLKFSPALIPELPKPLPMFEIFVYSPRVEGVHLRGGKVARGGLRWSDRMEDFRTEVLGLVKAQQVKNAVIVPVGAKGGFVAKQLRKGAGREEMMAEVIYSYRTFIKGLLDITDNLVDGEVVPPKNVIRKDDDDTYLVVAADKGTATFSDIANEIANDYNFWLGDAFASGGSVGYDHKKMGITARGAWVSVQRHFREMGKNVQTEPFTVVGIGDMSGDVFGNGMLCSRHIKLVAAFNHMHIFIDPTPDPEKSFLERERLFKLPRSSWEDYNAELISSGGAIVSRNAKSVSITQPMKDRFNIKEDRLTPNELVSVLLKAPVDLIWNGGIGTYVKSKKELNADVGDKANDAVRVNGSDLRTKVIGEGGNLGFTQLGRIEFGLSQGLSNTDFIDNAGGVDCSDHEVNIKILLNDVVANGDMTVKQRNQLLIEMTDEVSELVLMNNYRQTQSLSIAKSESVYRMGEYKRYIYSLVSEGRLDREIEFIPNDEELHDRIVNGHGLVRPELSTLLSYTKAILKEVLADSSIPNDPYISKEIETAFPALLTKRYRDQVYQHKLRNQIIATQVANCMVNFMGITFVHRMKDAAGSSVAEIAMAFIAAREVFDLESWWKQIESLDHKVKAEQQLEMMRMLIRLIRRATRWFLRNNRCGVNVEEVIKRFRPGVKMIAESLPSVLRGQRRENWEKRHNQFVEDGVPSALATFVAGADSMLPVLGIIQAAEITNKPLPEVAATYFAIGSQLDLFWFTEEVNKLVIENHWQALAREAYRDDLDWQQRTLTVGVLNLPAKVHSVEERMEIWLERHATLITRWKTMVAEFKATDIKEFSMYGVALRELMDIAQTTLHVEDLGGSGEIY